MQGHCCRGSYSLSGMGQGMHACTHLDVQRGPLPADVLAQRSGLLPSVISQVCVQVVLPANVVKSLAMAHKVHHLHDSSSSVLERR